MALLGRVLRSIRTLGTTSLDRAYEAVALRGEPDLTLIMDLRNGPLEGRDAHVDADRGCGLGH